MKRLRKILLVGIPVLLVLLIVGGIVLVSSLGSMVRTGLETLGPKMVGTSVTVEDVEISLLRGEVGIVGVVVGIILSRD